MDGISIEYNHKIVIYDDSMDGISIEYNHKIVIYDDSMDRISIGYNHKIVMYDDSIDRISIGYNHEIVIYDDSMDGIGYNLKLRSASHSFSLLSKMYKNVFWFAIIKILVDANSRFKEKRYL